MVIGTLIGIGLFIICPIVAWYLTLMIAYFMIFRKMGEPAWKAIIPVYHIYVQIKHVWDTKFFWIGLGCSLLSETMYYIHQQSGSNAIATIGWILSAVLVVICIMNAVKIAQAFGKGSVFTVGLILLHPLFIIILGFGKSEYIGPVKHE